MPNHPLDALALALPLVKAAEGCRLRAYLCPAGIPTCGWGETAGVQLGDVWTQQQADARLQLRLAQCMAGVLKRCPQLHLEPPGRLAACISLSYNIGLGAFGASQICRATRRCEYQRAADAFLLWNKAGARVLAG